MTSKLIKTYLTLSPVMPVVVINNIDDAIPLAHALMAGGVSIMEVTLRTEVALQAISLIRQEIPSMCVGAGTVNNTELFDKAIAAKAQFLVCPGVTDSLLVAAAKSDVPLLPGVVTPSEAMKLQDMGYSYLKFFPAEAAGGVNMLKSIAGPLPGISFCPTGGIDNRNYQSYLALNNVLCVGSSWLADGKLIAQKDWSEITRRAKQLTG
jgi:2-dehydro-3-deoxyphosphogluconate aldolase/(4S)-4-hydroxy-2-oxoglutarate aldolase